MRQALGWMLGNQRMMLCWRALKRQQAVSQQDGSHILRLGLVWYTKAWPADVRLLGGRTRKVYLTCKVWEVVIHCGRRDRWFYSDRRMQDAHWRKVRTLYMSSLGVYTFKVLTKERRKYEKNFQRWPHLSSYYQELKTVTYHVFFFCHLIEMKQHRHS